MATYNTTVDGAYRGNPEDIAYMKKRLSALLENQDKLDDPQWLRELFGEELVEIKEFDLFEDDDNLGPVNIYDEEKRSGVFEGFRYKWDNIDIENLQFNGYSPVNDYSSGDIEVFIRSIKRVFPRIKFHFMVLYKLGTLCNIR
jgi:hypothetical protein